MVANTLNSGDTAWMLTSTALVLFMTLPGLALFYSGLVRSRNVLSVMMQCFAIACAASLLWTVVGYTLVFGEGSAFGGMTAGFGKSFLAGVSSDSVSGSIPETVFIMFQMTFAIITPALIVGAFAERVRFAPMFAFCMLWVGWFGFNAGSALAANGSAGMAMLVTHLGAAAGSLAWMSAERIRFGKPSVLGIVTGMVAGLGTITPASGFVGPGGAVLIGLAGGFGGLGLPEGVSMGQQLGVQILGAVATIVWCGAVTFVLLKLINAVTPLRVTSDQENEGLDLVLHEERGYDL